MNVHPTREEWERFLEGELTTARAKHLELHKLECRDCKKAHAEALALFEELSHAPSELVATDLVPRVMARIGEPQQRSYRWMMAPLALAASVALFAVLPKTDPDGVRLKGTPIQADAWVGIEAFALGANGDLRALRNEPIAPDDSLAFAYRNIGTNPFRHLMIFGVSQRGEVYWYYPEYTERATDPQPISIDSGTFDLPDRVSHRLAPGRLYLYGLFTRAPYSVDTIEALAASVAAGERLPVPDSGQHILRVEVKR